MKIYQILVLVVFVTFLDVTLTARIARQAESESDEESNDIPKDPVPSDEGFPSDEDEEEESGDGFLFSIDLNPFKHLDDIYKHFEETLKRIHDFMTNDTMDISNDYNNTITETMVIDGKKYNITKTIIRKADNQSELYIRGFSMVPTDRKKRSLAKLE